MPLSGPPTCPMGPIFMMLANCSYMMLRQWRGALGRTNGFKKVGQDTNWQSMAEQSSKEHGMRQAAGAAERRQASYCAASPQRELSLGDFVQQLLLLVLLRLAGGENHGSTLSSWAVTLACTSAQRSAAAGDRELNEATSPPQHQKINSS